MDYILKPAGTLDPYEAEVIQSLLNAEGLEVNPDYAPRKGTPASRSALGELFLPLDGLIDLEAEKARLEGQLEKICQGNREGECETEQSEIHRTSARGRTAGS